MFPTPPPSVPPVPELDLPEPPPPKRKALSAGALAALLAAMSMLGPFSIDAYLPAFPSIQATLHTSPLEVQQSLSLYMFSFACMVLWHGALSDAFGRRAVVLVSLVLFAIGTLGCAASHSVHYLWAFRIMQGVSSGAGVVVGRAIIRDLYEDAAAARLLSMVTMFFSIGPAVAPVLGGWIVTLFDWRAIFLALLGYSVVLGLYCYYRLPETLPREKRPPFNPRFLARNYGEILRSPLFHMKSGIVALNFAGLFIYISSAPVLLPRHLHLGPEQFAWLFIPAVGGIFCGALVANRIAGRMTFMRQIGIGFAFLLTAAACNVLYHLWLPPALPWTVLPLFVYTFGMSIAAPAATLIALDLFPHIRGTVASCQSFETTLLGAVVAGVIAPFLSQSVLWLSLGQMGFCSLALVLWLTSRYYRSMLLRHPGDES